MTNKEKAYLRELAQEGRTFTEIRRLVTCSDTTITNYIADAAERTKYYVSFDGTHYGIGPAASVEEALALAAKEEMPEGTFAHIGEAVKFTPYAWACRVLEDVREQAYETCGDVSEDWLSDVAVSSECEAELGASLTTTLSNWLKKHQLEPEFFGITNVRTFECGTTIKEQQ